MTVIKKICWNIQKPTLISRSTRAFLSEARKVQKFSLFDFIHGYTYTRWPYLYVSSAVSSKNHELTLLFKILVRVYTWLIRWLPRNRKRGEINFEDAYHGKALPLDAARQLVSVKESIHLGDLEKVIPYKNARDIILNNPERIVALECPCRAARENPCLPMDVCLVIGEPFASFTAEHQPKRSRWITSQEAIQILEAEEQRGHVHHAFFKDAMLGRFYAICNCCSCCCGAIQAHKHGTPMLASSGYIAVVDAQRCISCGVCESFCQFGAITVGEQGAVIDTERCMGCGVCASHCAQSAIRLERDAAKGEPLEIEKLISTVAGERRK